MFLPNMVELCVALFRPAVPTCKRLVTTGLADSLSNGEGSLDPHLEYLVPLTSQLYATLS